MKVSITIELGNAGMQTPRDVADALKTVAFKLVNLEGALNGDDVWEAIKGSPLRVHDVYGNTVGRVRVDD